MFYNIPQVLAGEPAIPYFYRGNRLAHNVLIYIDYWIYSGGGLSEAGPDMAGILKNVKNVANIMSI